jgi:hypothetical protein
MSKKITEVANILNAYLQDMRKTSSDLQQEAGKLAIKLAEGMEMLGIKSVSSSEIKISCESDYYAYPNYSFIGFTGVIGGNPSIHILAYKKDEHWTTADSWTDDDYFLIFKADASQQYAFLRNYATLFAKLQGRAMEIRHNLNYVYYRVDLKNDDASHAYFGDVEVPFYENGIMNDDVFKWGKWCGYWTGMQWTSRMLRVHRDYIEYIRDKYDGVELYISDSKEF